MHASDDYIRNSANLDEFRSRLANLDARLSLSVSRTSFIDTLRPLAEARPCPDEWTWLSPNESHTGHHAVDDTREIAVQIVDVHRPYVPFTTHKFDQRLDPPVGRIIVVRAESER